ncbi:hypothetical protein [Dactylosporangium sp. NPDC049140]|uniref:hypothetical protein n=1 Tax=Dactylosporangium sp. NPDC049140 TaxID=3155647 RepID=UPI0033C4BD3E
MLTPLATRAAANPLGRVHARRAEPFLLMVRAEPEPDPETGAVRAAGSEYDTLDRLLRPHAPILTQFLGGRVVPGAITVVLTGAHWSRADLLGADVPEGPRRVRNAFWREMRAAEVDVIASRRRGHSRASCASRCSAPTNTVRRRSGTPRHLR